MKEKLPKTLMHDFLDHAMTGLEVEARSFEIIDREAPPHKFTKDQWEIVRRMIHTVGDFSIMDTVRFSPDAIAAGVRALSAGKPIYSDSNMIRHGLSLTRLQAVYKNYSKDNIFCHVADTDVSALAGKAGLPRSVFAVRKARPLLDGAIIALGNSPLALMEINRLVVGEGLKPALVIGMPVGFVHVAESKKELMSLDVPYIATVGPRGGSPLAVSVIHALCTIAGKEKDSLREAKHAAGNSELPRETARDTAVEPAIILLGHGSRAVGASDDMEKVARRLWQSLDYQIVELCQMSGLGVQFNEALEKCVKQRAKKIIVIPYFLHFGVHLRQDVPMLLREAIQSYPAVQLILGKNLGFDECLVDLVQKRITESAVLADVREMNFLPVDGEPASTDHHDHGDCDRKKD